jgi:hypothetical protein
LALSDQPERAVVQHRAEGCCRCEIVFSPKIKDSESLQILSDISWF